MYQSPDATPSGSRSNTPEVNASLALVTRSTPSAPSPRRRSHSAATAAGVNDSRPSGSGNSAKSFCVPWPLTNITCSGYVPPYPHRVLDVVGGAAVETGDPMVAPEPRPLAADIAAGTQESRVASVHAVPAAIEVGDDLGVSQRPRRGDAAAQAGVEQRPHLADEAVDEHLVRPLRQPLVEKRCVPIQSYHRGVPPRRAAQPRP